jgi:hypothetical protein
LREKNSGFSVYSQTPPYASSTQLPQRRDRPSSGLNAQRFVPRLMSFVGSYWPVGAVTLRLTPSRVFCRHVLISGKDMAGPPTRFTETLTTGSKRPDRWVDTRSPKSEPSKSPTP